MRAVLASAVIALASYTTARPLTVGDVAESVKSEEGSVSSGIGGSSLGSSTGSDGLDLNAIGGTGSSSSSSLPEVDDTNPLLSSLNDNLPSDADLMEEEAGSSSRGINSGSGIGSSELDMKFSHLDVPESSSSGFDPTSRNLDVEDEEGELDVSDGLTMPRDDGFGEMSEEQVREFVKYLAMILKENGGFDADGEGFEPGLNDDESDFAQPISSGLGEEDPEWLSAEGGSAIEEEGEEFSPEPMGLNAAQPTEDLDDSPFPNGRQLTPDEQAEFNAA